MNTKESIEETEDKDWIYKMRQKDQSKIRREAKKQRKHMKIRRKKQLA